MKRCYEDILSRIADSPKWFDEHGVPRYCDFSPKEVADIYAGTAALVLIACQNCGQTFKVAMSWTNSQFVSATALDRWPPPTSLLGLHYGDPPNIRCCPAGPTMNCDDLKILEWWQRRDTTENPLLPAAWGWCRVKEKEILLPDHPEYIK